MTHNSSQEYTPPPGPPPSHASRGLLHASPQPLAAQPKPQAAHITPSQGPQTPYTSPHPETLHLAASRGPKPPFIAVDHDFTLLHSGNPVFYIEAAGDGSLLTLFHDINGNVVFTLNRRHGKRRHLDFSHTWYASASNGVEIMAMTSSHSGYDISILATHSQNNATNWRLETAAFRGPTRIIDTTPGHQRGEVAVVHRDNSLKGVFASRRGYSIEVSAGVDGALVSAIVTAVEIQRGMEAAESSAAGASGGSSGGGGA